MKKPIIILVLSLLFINTQGQDIRTYPVLWQQTSAEYRALCYQAFNMGQSYLEKMLKEKKNGEKFAIITDLDETIIDNSYLEARGIKEGKEYTSSSWKEWVDLASATGVPGAVDFLQWAAKNNITIFYISNRSVRDIEATLSNLKKLQLPNADVDHMLFLSTQSTKEPRRLQVAKDYTIIMLLGDNLNDFADAFENKAIKERKEEVDKFRTEWGTKFIVLPNPMYGEWENVIYDHKRGLSNEQKDSIRKEKLILLQ